MLPIEQQDKIVIGNEETIKNFKLLFNKTIIYIRVIYILLTTIILYLTNNIMFDIKAMNAVKKHININLYIIYFITLNFIMILTLIYNYKQIIRENKNYPTKFKNSLLRKFVFSVYIILALTLLKIILKINIGTIPYQLYFFVIITLIISEMEYFDFISKNKFYIKDLIGNQK
jgi:hypothetical protein